MMCFFTAAVSGDFPWPRDAVSLNYNGNNYLLVPPRLGILPQIVLDYGTPRPSNGFAGYDKQRSIINSLLSALAWSASCGLHIEDAVESSRRTNLIYYGGQSRICQPTSVGLWLTVPENESQRRALAIYREAQWIGHKLPAVAMLWFFKILEIAAGEGRRKMLAFLQSLRHDLFGDAELRAREIESAGSQLETYLYEQR